MAARKPVEANFWQPGASQPYRLQPGELFLFKLHSPNNFIVGGGYFVKITALPASMACVAFGHSNGVEAYPDLLARLKKYRQRERVSDPTIGCNLLSEPFFWLREYWIPIPKDWSSNIVRGKSYDTSETAGASLWQDVFAQLPANQHASSVLELDRERFGAEYLARARLGQDAFRVLVTDAYNRRCAITGERTLPVLEAAHIKPSTQDGPHQIRNGLLFRSDIHTLFDRGYITVTPELNVEVSNRIRAEFENGREYYAHHGQELVALPKSAQDRPSAQFLSWHNENVFLD